MMTGTDFGNPSHGAPPLGVTEPGAPLTLSPALPSESGYIDSCHSGRGPPLCAGCLRPIYDEFILQVQGHKWHANCLRCSVCQVGLSHVCYSGNTDLYCQDDFFRIFGAQCGACRRMLAPTEVVRRAQDKVYHMNCFRCRECSQELNTGDEFYLCHDGQLLCQGDYLRVSAQEQEQVETSKNQPDQERVFRQHYRVCARPRPDTVHKIAREAGTQPSEVQSWFRQQRAKARWIDGGQGNPDEDRHVATTTRVLAPPGGYPLPIVNSAMSPGRLPTGASQPFQPVQQTSPHQNAPLPHTQISTHPAVPSTTQQASQVAATKPGTAHHHTLPPQQTLPHTTARNHTLTPQQQLPHTTARNHTLTPQQPLPHTTARNHTLPPQQQISHTSATKDHWTAWDELCSNDFVPPNVELHVSDVRHGEVIGCGYQSSSGPDTLSMFT